MSQPQIIPSCSNSNYPITTLRQSVTTIRTGSFIVCSQYKSTNQLRRCSYTYNKILDIYVFNFMSLKSKLMQCSYNKLDVRGSVHHCTIHIKNPTRCNSVSKFYLIFIWRSTCFGRHTAHHHKPKTALASYGFAYVEICWTCGCWTLSESSNYKSNNLPRMQKPEDASAVLGSWWWAVCRPKHVELHIHMK